MFIVFSGTDVGKRPIDVFTDLAAVPCASRGWNDVVPFLHAHGAILAQADHNYTMYKARVVAMIRQHSCSNVVFTGHSLGGGCALVMHMLAVGGALSGTADGLDETTFRSIVFEAPMVFYQFLPSDNDLDELRARVQSEELDWDYGRKQQGIVQEIFRSNSINWAVDRDIVPRLPGNPEHFLPLAKAFTRSLVTSKISEHLALPQVKGIAQRLANLVLDGDALKETTSDLKRFCHLSTLKVVETSDEGHIKGVKDMTNAEFKAMTNPTQEENPRDHWSYIVACHFVTNKQIKLSGLEAPAMPEAPASP